MDIFSPVGATVNLTAGGTTDRVAITQVAEPGIGSVSVRLYNSGTVVVFVEFGSSGVEAAAATSMPIPPGGVEVFEISPKATHMAGITGGAAATIYATCGRGA